jgi:DNA-binding CsgD family transcriptional regulator
MAQINDFFFDTNCVKGITDADYQQAQPYVEAAQAFAQTTYQSIYIIDYYKKNFLYVSDNPFFLCGHTAEEVRQMGYGFYLNYVPKAEVPMLLELNRSGFRTFYDQPEDKRRQCMMSYDFHIENNNRKLLINHKITPLVMTNEGLVWLALCTISLSSHKEAGHIQMRMFGHHDYWEYSLAVHRWERCELITLKPEEKQVLALAARGNSIHDISEQMYRSVDTIKLYRRNLFEKLDVASITEAVAFAVNYGLL